MKKYRYKCTWDEFLDKDLKNMDGIHLFERTDLGTSTVKELGYVQDGIYSYIISEMDNSIGSTPFDLVYNHYFGEEEKEPTLTEEELNEWMKKSPKYTVMPQITWTNEEVKELLRRLL